MNYLKLTFITLGTIILLTLNACKKDNTTTNNTTATSPVPSPVTPTIGSGVDGALVSIRVAFTYDPNKFASFPIAVPTVDLEAETATAVFGNLATSSYSNAGTVSVNTHSLDKLTNNSYVKTAFDYTSRNFSLDFDGGSNWSVGGSSDVTAFTYNHTDAFPNFTGRASMPETASTSSALTVNLNTISNADSVYVVFANNSNQIIKRLGASPTSVTFSAAEVASLGTTSGNATAILEVCPFKVKLQTINTKQYAFIKEYAAVQYVTIN